MVKIVQISDTHLGITSEKAITRLFREVAKEKFDVLVHCGDYCGGTMAHRTLRRTVEIMRQYIPNKPIITVLGNHDFWCGRADFKENIRQGGHRLKGRPPLEGFMNNYRKIQEIFKQHNIHFLDIDGPKTIKGVVFFGHSGWYRNPDPPTNDKNFLPIGLEGDTNRYLYKTAMRAVQNQLDKLLKNRKPRVFVSHFGVIASEDDYKGGFEDFGGDPFIGSMLKEAYGVKYFLQGHAHKLRTGPEVYECGSDYYKPKYQILELTW